MLAFVARPKVRFGVMLPTISPPTVVGFACCHVHAADAGLRRSSLFARRGDVAIMAVVVAAAAVAVLRVVVVVCCGCCCSSVAPPLYRYHRSRRVRVVSCEPPSPA